MQRYLKSRRGGVVGSTSDHRWLNQPPRLRGFGGFASFYYWRSHPSLTKEGSAPSPRFPSVSSGRLLGKDQPFQGGEFLALVLILLFSFAGFAQSSAPSVTVDGAPVLLSQPLTRVGGEWFVPLRSIAKALQIEVTLTAGSPLLYARRAAGDEITYDFRTGEIRDRYVLIGTVKQYQNVKQAPSADTLLFPVSGVVALLGVDVAEDAQLNILEFSSSPFASRNSSTGPALNLSKMDYRYGMTTNGQKVAQFLDLNGEALIGSVRTKGKALLSGYPGQGGIGIVRLSGKQAIDLLVSRLLGIRIGNGLQ